MSKKYAEKDAELPIRAVRHPHIPGMWCYRLTDSACEDLRIGALSFAEAGAPVCAVADIVDVKPGKVLAFLQDEGYVTPCEGVVTDGVLAALKHFGGSVSEGGFRAPVDTGVLDALRQHLLGDMPAVIFIGDGQRRSTALVVAGYDEKRDEALLFDPRGADRDGWYPWDWVAHKARVCVLAMTPEEDPYAPRYIFKNVYGIDIAGHEQRWPDIDLQILQGINPGCIGWIHLGGTPLSYPIVKDRLDATYYQTHNFSGEPSVHGQVSLSFANGGAFDAPNLLFSAHRMKDHSMFKMLTVYDRQDFSEEHPCIDLLLGDRLYRAQVFSAYHFPKQRVERESYRVEFADDADFKRWVRERIERSMHPFSSLSQVGQVATFRTCYGIENDQTFVLHAFLQEMPTNLRRQTGCCTV